jgi:hypothetical protein
MSSFYFDLLNTVNQQLPKAYESSSYAYGSGYGLGYGGSVPALHAREPIDSICCESSNPSRQTILTL